jgi:ABC-type transporter Mla maintaining outer membrane lipid asymmetry permease subunit MlaE
MSIPTFTLIGIGGGYLLGTSKLGMEMKFGKNTNNESFLVNVGMGALNGIAFSLIGGGIGCISGILYKYKGKQIISQIIKSYKNNKQ